MTLDSKRVFSDTVRAEANILSWIKGGACKREMGVHKYSSFIIYVLSESVGKLCQLSETGPVDARQRQCGRRQIAALFFSLFWFGLSWFLDNASIHIHSLVGHPTNPWSNLLI